jgi:hypothetical protein
MLIQTQFNASSLGEAEYKNLSSPLFQNISALVGSDSGHVPSITRDLGVKDWYEMHYLAVCSGFYGISAVYLPLRLTDERFDVECERQASGYTFSLRAILEDELGLSVRTLTNGVASEDEIGTKTWIGLWITGIVFCVLGIAVLPTSFNGWNRNSAFTSLFSGVSY